MRNIDHAQTSFDYEYWVGCSRDVFRRQMLLKLDNWNKLTGHRISLRMCDCDHICPFSIVQFMRPELHERACRMLCHYTNLQPMPGVFNRFKSDHWSARDHEFWLARIYKNPDFVDIYWPVHI